MPQIRASIPISRLGSGGVNEDDAPDALDRTQLRIARNVYLKGSALSSRPGSSRLQTTAINSGAAGNGIFQFVRTQGTVFNLIAVFGNSVYDNVTAASPTNITGSVTITAGQNNQVTFTNAYEIVIMCNGTDSPWEWSGTGNVTLLGGTPPAFNTMIAKWNRVFGAGHAAAPRTVRFSALGDRATWPAANTVAAILGDSSSAIEGRDYIYQLGHLGDSIFVGLATSIGRILYTGDSTTPFRYNQLANFGIEGSHSFVAVGNGGYFLSKYGVHFIRSTDVQITYETSLISGRRLRTTWDALNISRIRRTYGTLYRTASGNLLVMWPLTSGSGTVHDTVLVMDVTDGPGKERFFWWTGWDANAMTAAVNTSTFASRLYFTSTAGYVWQGDTGNDDNTAAYLAEAATRWEDFDAPNVQKKLRQLYIEARQTGAFSLTIETYFDYATTPTQRIAQSLAGAAQAAWNTGVWNTALWPTLGFLQSNVFGAGDGTVMSVRFYTAGAGQPWSVYKLVPAVRPTGTYRQST